MLSRGQYRENLADSLRGGFPPHPIPGFNFHFDDSAAEYSTTASPIDASGPLAAFMPTIVSRPASSTKHAIDTANPFQERLSLMLGGLTALVTGVLVICAAILTAL